MYQAIVEQAPDAIIVADRDGSIARACRGAGGKDKHRILRGLFPEAGRHLAPKEINAGPGVTVRAQRFSWPILFLTFAHSSASGNAGFIAMIGFHIFASSTLSGMKAR